MNAGKLSPMNHNTDPRTMSPVRAIAPLLGCLCFVGAIVAFALGGWQVAIGMLAAGVLLWLARGKIDPNTMREFEERYDRSTLNMPAAPPPKDDTQE